MENWPKCRKLVVALLCIKSRNKSINLLYYIVISIDIKNKLRVFCYCCVVFIVVIFVVVIAAAVILVEPMIIYTISWTPTVYL